MCLEQGWETVTSLHKGVSSPLHVNVDCLCTRELSQHWLYCIRLAEVSLATTLQAVAQIAVGPRLLDLGKVSAASRNTRYLAVTNSLMQSIHVVLAVAHLPELKDSEPVSQVTTLRPDVLPCASTWTVLFCWLCLYVVQDSWAVHADCMRCVLCVQSAFCLDVFVMCSGEVQSMAVRMLYVCACTRHTHGIVLMCTCGEYVNHHLKMACIYFWCVCGI